MRTGVKIFIGVLLLAIVVLLVGPVLYGLFVGPGFDP